MSVVVVDLDQAPEVNIEESLGGIRALRSLQSTVHFRQEQNARSCAGERIVPDLKFQLGRPNLAVCQDRERAEQQMKGASHVRVRGRRADKIDPRKNLPIKGERDGRSKIRHLADLHGIFMRRIIFRLIVVEGRPGILHAGSRCIRRQLLHGKTGADLADARRHLREERGVILQQVGQPTVQCAWCRHQLLQSHGEFTRSRSGEKHVILEDFGMAARLENGGGDLRQVLQHSVLCCREFAWFAIDHAQAAERETIWGVDRDTRVKADTRLACDQRVIGKSRILHRVGDGEYWISTKNGVRAE